MPDHGRPLHDPNGTGAQRNDARDDNSQLQEATLSVPVHDCCSSASAGECPQWVESRHYGTNLGQNEDAKKSIDLRIGYCRTIAEMDDDGSQFVRKYLILLVTPTGLEPVFSP